MTVETITFGCCAGLLATVTMDLLATVSRKLGVAAGAKGAWVGRWYLGIIRGRFVHADIAAAPKLAGEERAAWLGHYVIGMALAVLYFAGAEWVGARSDGFLEALGYGLATGEFPWLLVLPALGFGWFGLRGPPELRLFRTSLINHLSYGFGLWWTAVLLPFD